MAGSAICGAKVLHKWMIVIAVLSIGASIQRPRGRYWSIDRTRIFASDELQPGLELFLFRRNRLDR